MQLDLSTIGGFGKKPTIAVAVSGGTDSLALALLADAWAKEEGGKIIALTVDHKLRKDSAKEAAHVGELLKQRGIEHHILTHNHAIPKSNIQAWARDLRYGLMSEFCAKNKIKHLLLGHQMDDNVETFFLHLERGSGLKGLSGMRTISMRGNLRLVRPLLNTTRAELDAYLKEQNITPVEDPTNVDAKYRRSALRAVLKPFFAETPNLMERISLSMRYLFEADATLDAFYEWQRPQVLTLEPGRAVMDSAALDDSPFALRILADAIIHVSGSSEVPRAAELQRALALKHFTLHGVKGTRTAKELVLVPEFPLKKKVRGSRPSPG